jgi:hypothetical protein
MERSRSGRRGALSTRIVGAVDVSFLALAQHARNVQLIARFSCDRSDGLAIGAAAERYQHRRVRRCDALVDSLRIDMNMRNRYKQKLHQCMTFWR